MSHHSDSFRLYRRGTAVVYTFSLVSSAFSLGKYSTLTGRAALQEQWRWTELAAKGKRDEWRKIIQRTDGWREREKEQAEATAAANRARRGATARNRAPRAPQAGNGRYAAVPPPPPPGDGNNARDARAARRAAREQANQQQGGYWN